MNQCPHDLLDAAANDRLTTQQSESLQSHLSTCQDCCKKLEDTAASPDWWADASRLLDVAALDDPAGDVADSSEIDARVFEADDPVAELRAAGVIDQATHPEMLGKLGRYVIEREIGAGGMGVVLKGYDVELNRTVAIKVLAPHLARSGAARQRFVREGRAAAAVVHENVVAIHEVDTSRKLPTLVMRYVDGVSLQRHVDSIGPLSICDALRIASQTAAGLAAAHRQGIVHRDVKPANILVSRAGGRVWITDFGLARAVDDASLTRTGFIAGTPHYMSPEQARGASVGPASDLFSLGGVLYFMLTARPPWRAERSLAVLHRIVREAHRPLWQLNPDVPREVSDLVDQLLTKSPQERDRSAVQVQEQLESILSNLQNPSMPHSLAMQSDKVAHVRQSKRSSPWLLVPMTALITFALTFYGPAILSVFRSTQQLSEPTSEFTGEPVAAAEATADTKSPNSLEPNRGSKSNNKNQVNVATTSPRSDSSRSDSLNSAGDEPLVQAAQKRRGSEKTRPMIATSGFEMPANSQSNSSTLESMQEVVPIGTPAPILGSISSESNDGAVSFPPTMLEDIWLAMDQLDQMLLEMEATLAIPSEVSVDVSFQPALELPTVPATDD